MSCGNYSYPIVINSVQSSVRAVIRQTNDANANSGLAIQKKHSTLHPANHWYGDISFEGWDGSGYHKGGLIECVAEGTPANDNMPGMLRFSTNSGGTSPTERFRITSGGQLRLMSGNSVKMSVYHDSSGGLNHITSNNGNEIKVSCGNGNSNGIEFWDYTGVNKRCQIDAEGIKFNTDTAAANGLDDYEEGSFTPAYDAQNQAGTTFSFSHQYGYYTKIGNIVNITVYIQGKATSNTSGGSNDNITVTGLPFSSANLPGGGNTRHAPSLAIGSTYRIQADNLQGRIFGGQNYATLMVHSNGGTGTPLKSNQIDPGSGTTELYFSCTYRVA